MLGGNLLRELRKPPCILCGHDTDDRHHYDSRHQCCSTHKEPSVGAGEDVGCRAPGKAVDSSEADNYSEPMLLTLAHLTPLEAPVVWLAFAAGLACGIAGTLALVRRRATASNR